MPELSYTGVDARPRIQTFRKLSEFTQTGERTRTKSSFGGNGEPYLAAITKPKLLHSQEEEFDYDVGEEIRLEDLRHTLNKRKILRTTTQVYEAACSKFNIAPIHGFLKSLLTGIVQLQHQKLGPDEIRPLAVSLVKDRHVAILDLSFNNLGPLGVTYIAEALQEHVTIFELDLSATNLEHSGLSSLAESLRKNKSLKILRLESNELESKHMDLIVDIMENILQLQELYLGHNKLGNGSGKLFARAISINKNLRVLDLKWNHLRRESAVAISKSLENNKCLRRLDLSWNGWGKEGCLALSKSLPQNTTLVDLNLSSNRIDMMSLGFFLRGLVSNSNIKCIDLGSNPMTTEGAKAVIDALKSADNSSVTDVILNDIPVDKEFVEKVSELRKKKYTRVSHGAELNSTITLEVREHDPNDLNRFDPVLVLFEYMRFDNLRLIDFFQFLDTSNRDRLTKNDIREGCVTLSLPLTEYHLDCVMEKIDVKKDGAIDIEQFMIAHRECSRQVTQRVTRARAKGKEDEGLLSLRKMLRDIIDKRNQSQREKARRLSSRKWASAISKLSAVGSFISSKDSDKLDMNRRRKSVPTTGTSSSFGLSERNFATKQRPSMYNATSLKPMLEHSESKDHDSEDKDDGTILEMFPKRSVQNAS